MSFVSLQKYLYASRKQSEVGEDDSPGSYIELSSRIMVAMRRSVFTGEVFADLSEELDDLRKNLVVESEAVVSVHADRMDNLLDRYQHRVQQANREKSNDFRNICNILNETFTHVSTGNERSNTRLQELETGLKRAAQIDDLATIRMQLVKMLDYVREEETREHSEGQAAIESLSLQIRQAHNAKSRFRVQLPGRPEVLERLALELAHPDTLGKLRLALFTADSLRAIRTRHGNEIAANMLEEFARKEVQALAPDGEVFCWSPTSVLLIWLLEDASASPGELPNKLKTPFEYRVFVGTRVAVFNLKIRSLVTQAVGPVEEIGGRLDCFSKGGL